MKRDESAGFADALSISLVSGDSQLLDILHEAVRDLDIDNCDIILLGPHQKPPPNSDLLIWDTDYLEGIRREPRPASAARPPELFLVSRKRLDDFLATMPLGAGSTLLKPVNKRVLQIFLEQALFHSKVSPPRSFSSLAVAPETDDALQCLLMANLKLQEYDQDRTNFLARAVHDFRAPLMAANGYCSILLQQTLGPLAESQTELVKRMHRSLKKLSRMASAMFQLNVSKTVMRGLNLKESSMESCVTAAFQDVDHLVHEKNLTVSVSLKESKSSLYFDAEQIEQVLVNLLDNACRFTSKGGRIEVHGYPLTSEEVASDRQRDTPGFISGSPLAYRVDVIDNGPGILAEHLGSVFEEYTSYSGPEDRSGGGLGLAICKIILETHGGRIWAENYPGGAKLCFMLPAGNPQAWKRIAANSELNAVACRAVS